MYLFEFSWVNIFHIPESSLWTNINDLIIAAFKAPPNLTISKQWTSIKASAQQVILADLYSDKPLSSFHRDKVFLLDWQKFIHHIFKAKKSPKNVYYTKYFGIFYWHVKLLSNSNRSESRFIELTGGNRNEQSLAAVLVVTAYAYFQQHRAKWTEELFTKLYSAGNKLYSIHSKGGHLRPDELPAFRYGQHKFEPTIFNDKNTAVDYWTTDEFVLLSRFFLESRKNVFFLNAASYYGIFRLLNGENGYTYFLFNPNVDTQPQTFEFSNLEDLAIHVFTMLDTTYSISSQIVRTVEPIYFYAYFVSMSPESTNNTPGVIDLN